MLTISDVLEKEFRRLIKEVVENRTEVILNPAAGIDFAEFRHQVGFIAGLREAVDIIDEARKNCDKRERGT